MAVPSNPFMKWCIANKIDFTALTAFSRFFNEEIFPKIPLGSKYCTFVFEGYPLTFTLVNGLHQPSKVTDDIFKAWRHNRTVLVDSHLSFSKYISKPTPVFAVQADSSFILFSNGVIYEGREGDYIVDYGKCKTVKSKDRFEAMFYKAP